MQQILAGMNELNERVQSVEARETDAERQARTTQQELVRLQTGAKGKGKGEAMPLQQEQRICRLRRSTTLQPFESEDDKWGEWARVFRSWSGRLLGGAMADICEHVEGHRNDSATIPDLALTSLKFGCGIASQPFHHRAVSRVDHVDERTTTTVGAQSGRRGWKT